MRYLNLFFSVFFLFGSSSANPAAATTPRSGDSVVIEKKKVVLVRTGQIARDFPERKRATVSYPVVKGGIDNPAVLRKVRSLLQLKNIFDTSLEEYREDAWLTEFDYKVNYNKNFILDITFMQSGVAAYPDTHEKHLAINLKTGKLIKANEVFKPASLKTLAEMVDRKLQDEIKRIQKENMESEELSKEDKENFPDLFAELKFNVDNLDEFSISDKGITFLYDAGFPHVVQALQPEGRYFFSYAELRPHIKQESLLGRFIQ
jgi:hypothetical protein